MTADLDNLHAGPSWHCFVRVRRSWSYVKVHGRRRKTVVGATSSDSFLGCRGKLLAALYESHRMTSVTLKCANNLSLESQIPLR